MSKFDYLDWQAERDNEQSFVEKWAQQKREQVFDTVAELLRPTGKARDIDDVTQIFASAWAADCPYLRNFMQVHGLDDAHFACILDRKGEVVDYYMRDIEDYHVSTAL